MAQCLNKFVSRFPERVDEPLYMRDRIAKATLT